MGEVMGSFKNSFGAEVKEGESIPLLKRVRQYFQDNYENCYIVKYYCCNDTKTKSKNWVDEKNLKECAICGRNLYEWDSKSFRGDDEEEYVKQKRHMVLLDSEGKKHNTCFGVKWCFSRVGYKVGEVDDRVDKIFDAPSFEEFIKIDQSTVNKDDYPFQSLKKYYYDRVVPFLNDWVYTQITKKNVLDFVSSFYDIEKFLKLFEQPARRKVKGKIYNLIGVKHEQ